jgi:hypothetical protein
LITAEGDTRFLTGNRSMLPGVDLTRLRPDATEVLPANCTVLFYTDGLIERRAEHSSAARPGCASTPPPSYTHQSTQPPPLECQ